MDESEPVVDDVPLFWNELVARHQWYRLTPLIYEHLDENQNRNVFQWVEKMARNHGHVPLWYFSLRNRLKHVQHVLLPSEFRIVLTDMIVVTVRIVEDIVSCKNIYGIVSSNAFSLLRTKLVAWVHKFESKPWKPIPVTRGADTWTEWISSQPLVTNIIGGGGSSLDASAATSTSTSTSSSVYNTWPSFTSVMGPFLKDPESFCLTSTEKLRDVHCAWTSNVYHSGLSTIVFGNVVDKLVPTLETNQNAAKLQRDSVREYMFKAFRRMNTWDEFWNVALSDLIPPN